MTTNATTISTMQAKIEEQARDIGMLCERKSQLMARVGELERDKEELINSAEMYKVIRKGQYFSVINGVGCYLRNEMLDAEIEAVLRQNKMHEVIPSKMIGKF